MKVMVNVKFIRPIGYKGRPIEEIVKELPVTVSTSWAEDVKYGEFGAGFMVSYQRLEPDKWFNVPAKFLQTVLDHRDVILTLMGNCEVECCVIIYTQDDWNPGVDVPHDVLIKLIALRAKFKLDIYVEEESDQTPLVPLSEEEDVQYLYADREYS